MKIAEKDGKSDAPEQETSPSEDLKKANEEQPQSPEKENKQPEKKPQDPKKETPKKETPPEEKKEPRPPNHLYVNKRMMVDTFIRKAMELLTVDKFPEIVVKSRGNEANGIAINMLEALKNSFFKDSDKFKSEVKTSTHQFQGRKGLVNITELEITIRSG